MVGLVPGSSGAGGSGDQSHRWVLESGVLRGGVFKCFFYTIANMVTATLPLSHPHSPTDCGSSEGVQFLGQVKGLC